jgi:hypothetical protein
MDIERKKDLSYFYWLKGLFSSNPIIKVVDDFQEDKLTVPTVCIEIGDLYIVPKEMGNRHGTKLRSWVIDVYGKNKSQRNEITFKILDALEETVPVYNYDEGFPPDVNPTIIGCMDNDNIHMTPIRVLPELVEVLYWRAQISFEGTYSDA